MPLSLPDLPRVNPPSLPHLTSGLRLPTWKPEDIFAPLTDPLKPIREGLDRIFPGFSPTSTLIKSLVGPYIDYMRGQSTEKALPPKFRWVLSKHYQQNMDLVTYYENVNTLHGQAITIGNEIFFPRSIDLNARADVHWLLHEVEHVDQYKREGGVSPFMKRYFADAITIFTRQFHFNIHNKLELEQAASAKADAVIDQVWENLKRNSEFTLHTGTKLHITDSNYHFMLASNNDLFVIKKQGASNSTEVHVLSAASNYQEFTLQTGTCLHPTDHGFDFMLARNNDIYAIKRQGASNSTEVHVLSAAKGYREYSLQTGTALHPTDGNYQFLLADNNDVYVVKKQGGADCTEVHALSAAHNYQVFSVHSTTALHPTDATFEFMLNAQNDLYIISKRGRSNSSEVHVLTAASGYKTFSVHSPTCLHHTDENYQFLLSRNGDIYVVKKNNTGTNTTEVHAFRLFL